jgi:uncharacterized RDD family membrane protein YckC
MTSQHNAEDVHVTGRRVVATIIDAVVFSVLSGALSLLFGVHPTSGFDLTELTSGGSTLLLVIVVLYYVLLEGLLGRTLGKMATGIKVVDQRTLAAPGMGSAVLRTILRVVDGFFGYLLGFVIVLSSRNRRRLGDMAARTIVVRS